MSASNSPQKPESLNKLVPMAAAAAVNTRIIEPRNVIKVPAARNSRISNSVVLLQMCHFPREVQQLHAQLIVSGLVQHHLNPGRLIESYVSASHFSSALLVFESIPCPDLFAYNTMIRGLMLGPEFPDHMPLLLYQDLLSIRDLKADNHTFTFVLKTCSRMKAVSEGKQVHGQMIKVGLEPNIHTRSSLIHMYSNCGDMESANGVLLETDEENVLAMNTMITGHFNRGHFEIARELFEKMRRKDTATWSAMISGYTNCNMHAQAVSLFQEMLVNKVQPNESTLVSALCACAHLGALAQGRWIHSYEVFNNMTEKDVVTWGAIISGFSIHGQARKCFQLFDEMVGSAIMPNAVIFVAILSACSHGGFIKLGFHYFNEMVHRFRISPSVEHYGCTADLLGRAGRLAEAEELISCMSEKPNSVIWGALLSAAIIHKDIERGERALRELMKLGPLPADRYKQVGNLFATMGMKENTNDAWSSVKGKKMELARGLSFIEVDGVVHEFVAGDISHTNSADIFKMLDGTH